MTATLIGLGNIGSPAAELLARLPEVTHLTLIDNDHYTPENRTTQLIQPRDIGQPKALAVARRLRQLRSELRVEAHVARVEDLPPSVVRADVLCTATDSLASRAYVNELSYLLGAVPWVDAGVQGAERLARVEVFYPSAEQPCLECGWTEQHYRRAGVRAACQTALPSAPTNAPAHLGALAAALQVQEVEAILQGRRRTGHQQLLLAAPTMQLFLSQNRRSQTCRFHHRVTQPQPLPLRTTVGHLDASTISAFGYHYLAELGCHYCQFKGQCNRFVRIAQDRALPCPQCGQAVLIPAFSLESHLVVTPARRKLRLKALGLRKGDCITVGDHTYLLTGATHGSNS